MKKILVPCDFSKPAREAFQFARTWAMKQEAEILVLYVIDLPVSYESTFGLQPFYVDAALLKELRETATKKFAKLQEEYPGKSPVTLHVLSGPVALTTAEFIREQGIDLVVMGTHGSDGLEEYFIGSNAEKIVRRSTVPVIALRRAVALDSIRNLVVPTTLDLNQTEFMNRVKDLQKMLNAKLHMLLVNTPTHFKREPDTQALLEEFALHYRLENFTLNARSDLFESEGILAFAKEVKADMLAMGTHSRRGLAHLLMGSVTEDVVNHIDCPIWTYTLKHRKP
jgi:nucleotide-binding universal stress UspA family protein